MKTVGELLEGQDVAPAPPSETASDCLLCDGLGFTRVAVDIKDPRFGQAILCECRRRQARPPFGITPATSAQTFAAFDLERNPKMTAALEQCQAVAEGRARCAFLIGSYGNGKTHLARAALLMWWERERSGAFWKVPAFLAYLRGALSRRIEEGVAGGVDQEIAAWSANPGLVVFDDLGTENQTEWTSEQLYMVLDHRYEEGLPTILTANAGTAAERDARLHPRIRSRYRAGLVLCEGADLR